MLITPAFIDIERIIKANPNFFSFIFLSLTIFFFLLYTILINLMLILTIFGYSLCISMIGIVLYVHLNNKKVLESQGKEKKDILSAFSRPKKLTEEEVSIAKEKQICLVCKNKLGGHIFLCSSCGAFYCVKCSDTLSGMENACWVCDAPFDESKPVKLPEDKEKEDEIEVKPQKRGVGK
jgi:hypothetical protein